MAAPGGVTGQAPGATEDIIIYFAANAVSLRTIRVRFRPHPDYYNRSFGIFVNGVLRKVISDISIERPMSESFIALQPGETGAYVYIEDLGDWYFDIDDPRVPTDPAREKEATISDKLSFTWETSTTFSQANGYILGNCGSSQLSNISVTGMQRFTNVKEIPQMPRRARLDYTIQLTTAGIVVSWFKGTTLVAQGITDATGTGGTDVTNLVCSEANKSGLTVTCDLDFQGNINNVDEGFIIMGWPDSYQVHYSAASALEFPRTPEGNVIDVGNDTFGFETPSIDPGTYQAAIVPVRDGVALSSGILVVEDIELNQVPLAPTIETISGNSDAITVAWAAGESGCTYKVYSSYPDMPINYGNFGNPPVQSVGVDVLEATLDPIPASLVAAGFIRIAVRATKNGIQELNNKEFVLEIDDAGNLIQPRPNKASVNRATVDNLSLSLEVMVGALERSANAHYIDLYIVPSDQDFDFVADAQATVAIGAAKITSSNQRATISYEVPSPGCYKYCVRARYNADGGSGTDEAGEKVLSYAYNIFYQWFTDAEPGAVSNLSVKPRRQAR